MRIPCDYEFNFLYDIEIQGILSYGIFFPGLMRSSGLIANHIYYYIWYDGIFLINLQSKKARYYSFQELIKENGSIARCSANESEIQISVQGYLIIFHHDLTLKEKPIKFPENLAYASSSYRDRQGNIWLTDLNNGITFIPNNHLKNDYYLHTKKVKIGLGNFIIKSEYFYGFDTKNNKFKKYEDLPGDRIVYQIYNELKADSSYLTILLEANSSYLTTLNDTYLFNRPNLHWSFRGNSFLNPMKDIVQFNGYLYKISFHGLDIINIKSKERKSITKRGLFLVAVHKNKVYVGGSDGLFVYEEDTLVRPYLKSNLLEIPINSTLSTDDYLIVGTGGNGIYLFNEKSNIPIKSTQGLIIQKIIKKGNYLWLGTDQGVKNLKLNTNNLADSKIVNTFNEADGLLENNVNDFLLKDSTLYTASDLGVTKINLNSPLFKKKPKLYFKTSKDTLDIAPKENRVSISFSVLDYVNQEYLTYKYRLLPLQKEWIPTKIKTLNFNNLDPKLYTLEVQATDQHNNTTTKKLYINVIPEWWEKLWFKLLMVVLGLLLFLLVIKMIKRNIQKKEFKKMTIEKQIAGLELQALRSQMNPHFVHNSLNAIQYYIQQNEIALSEDYLGKFSILIRQFFEYSRTQVVSIHEEVTLLTNYLEIEQLRFEDKLKFKITVDNQIDADDQVIPSMILQPIVENSVNHGIFHKENGGSVSVHFKYIDAFSFQVEIQDDGIGIEKAKEMNKKSLNNYQSKSSNVIVERLEILNQSKDWKISYHIKDLTTLEGASGTLTTLVFNQLER